MGAARAACAAQRQTTNEASMFMARSKQLRSRASSQKLRWISENSLEPPGPILFSMAMKICQPFHAARACLLGALALCAAFIQPQTAQSASDGGPALGYIGTY